MSERTCPPTRHLSQLVQCTLDEAEASDLLQHLDECPACEETVAAMEARDTKVMRRVEAVELPYESEPECRQAVARILAARPAEGPSESDLLPSGSMLRDYRIVRRLGAGGMGAVYLAIHQHLERSVALKVIHPQYQARADTKSRFLREIKSLGQLQHPHIVRAIDASCDGPQPFLVMEYVEGIDTAALISREEKLSVADACLIACQAASGLQFAADKGFVHRDIKPSNLMLCKSVDADGHETAVVKVLDLGLTRAISGGESVAADATELTAADQFMGTLDYMAPEQGGDARQVDPRADIYSLGATLFKLLTGEAPFAGHAGKPLLQRITAIATSPTPNVRELRPEVPVELAAIVQRMMARAPADRFSSCREVIKVLQPYCADADLAALLLPRDQRPERARPAAVATTPQRRSPPPRSRRRLAAWFAGGMALLLFAAIIINDTRYGRVEITAPNGTLPDDVQVVVSQNGEEIAVLQADNHWSAKLVKGEYKIELRGGDDSLALQDRQLTISRRGIARLTMRVVPNSELPAATAPDTKPLAGENTKPSVPDVPPPAVKFAANPEKPFTLTRDGVSQRAFKTLSGAIADAVAGDVIVIEASSPLEVRLTQSIAVPLHLKAAERCRPLLVLVEGNHRELPKLELSHDLTCEGIDWDLRRINIEPVAGAIVHAKFRRCRLWGYYTVFANQLDLQNCVVVAGIGPTGVGANATVTLDNCLVRCWHKSVCFLSPGKHELTLRNCTFHLVSNEWQTMFVAPSEASVHVESRGNLFHDSAQGYIIDTTHPESWDWHGQDNCFAGDFFETLVSKEDGSEHLTGDKGLTAWNKLRKTPEQDALELPSVELEIGRLQKLRGLDLITALEPEVQHLRAESHLATAGPAFPQLGAGEGYLTAQAAAAGRPVTDIELRPEAPDGKTCVLFRDGQQVAEARSLPEAMEMANDGDVIEIRTNNRIDAINWTGRGRRLTIRAAAGYAVSVAHLGQLTGGDRLTLVGLNLGSVQIGDYQGRLQESAPPSDHPIGGIDAIINCTFDDPSGGVRAPIAGDGETPVIIRNSLIPSLHVVLNVGSTLRVENCILNTSTYATWEGAEDTANVEIANCLHWLPDSASRGQVEASPVVHTRIESSMFVAPESVLGSPFPINQLEEHNNVYVMPNGMHYQHDVDLARLRSKLKASSGSVELLPRHFDPAQWRVRREATPDYQPRSDDEDYGAVIDNFTTIDDFDLSNVSKRNVVLASSDEAQTMWFRHSNDRAELTAGGTGKK